MIRFCKKIITFTSNHLKTLFVSLFILLFLGYQSIQFLKVKRIEDYSHILYKASSTKDKAFSILLGDYISRNKYNYNWDQFGNMEEYFLYLELKPENPDYNKIKEISYLESDSRYPDLLLPSLDSVSKTKSLSLSI
ncbi:MAG: hypothetical protein KC646_00805 [Candidatus Cloacimonetes bacterium]|nr:hypothetical protein [Candidatus Cloacimonadota bacterium]